MNTIPGFELHPEAAQDILDIWEFIANENVNAAGRRDGPSGSSRRVATLAPGRTVRMVSSFDRWRYVEVLDAQSQGTGVTGWIYGRNLRVE